MTAYIPNSHTQLSPRNSTETPLTSGSTYTGTWEDVSGYPSVVAACLSDVAGTLYLEFSTDGVTVHSSLPYQVAANINEVHRLTVTRQYYRAKYTNGSTGQTSFNLTSLLGAHTNLSAPLNLTLSQDADAIAVRSIDSEIDIAEGKRAGYTIVNKFGRNPDIDTGTVPEDIWEGGGAYTGFPVGDDELITAVSSSGNDTSAGSGAKTILIHGLDTNGTEQSETIILNGTSLVDSVNTYTRVNRIQVITSGSSNQAFNAGTISIAHKTTTANVFASVPIGTNQSQVAAYTIPVGKVGYFRQWMIELSKNKSAYIEGALWVRESGSSPRYIRIFEASNTEGHFETIYGGLVLPALTDVVIRITSTSVSNVLVTGSFDILVVDS